MRDDKSIRILGEYALKNGFLLQIPDCHYLEGEETRGIDLEVDFENEKTCHNNDIGEISVAGYYNCCGSKIIHSLVYHSDLVAWILIRAAILATWGNGSLQYICTNKQKRIENALIGNGFKLVQKVRNPKTGRCLLLYVYNQK